MQLDEALLRVASLAWQETQDSAVALEEIANWGRYDGHVPHLELLDYESQTRLLEPLGYVDASERRWDVTAREVLDGASIPKPLWSLIGGPWSRRYQSAFIVHDRYCLTRLANWQQTHRMFHDAMRCGGVHATKRFILPANRRSRWTSGLADIEAGRRSNAAN